MDGFYGLYTHSVDTKGRFSIPARIRQALPPEAPNTIVFTRGLGPFFSGYTLPAFQELKERVRALPMGSKDAAAFKRVFGSTVNFCEIDPQGRVLILPKVLEILGIKRSVVIVGAEDHIELWDPAAYEENEAEAQAGYEAGMRRFFS